MFDRRKKNQKAKPDSGITCWRRASKQEEEAIIPTKKKHPINEEDVAQLTTIKWAWHPYALWEDGVTSLNKWLVDLVQLLQEGHILCRLKTGETLPNGDLVYK